MSFIRDYLIFLSTFCCYHVAEAQYSSSCSSGTDTIRLYDSHVTDTSVTLEEGMVQYCYGGYWYAACDYNWDCKEANVVCKQLGFDKARSYVYNADYYYGYWGYFRHYYHYCSTGSETSLSSCSSYYSYYGCYSHYYDEAGVRCIKTHRSNSSCTNETLRLTGGKSSNEGVLEYCYNNQWSIFCNLDEKEASVACKQLGFTKFAAFLSDGDYEWEWPTNYTESMFNYFSCSSSATESSLSECSLTTTPSSSYTSCVTSCLYPKAIKCTAFFDGCIDGEVRLSNGVIQQEGRVEICVDGIWGGICVDTWTKQTAYVICKQLGYFASEPVIDTNGKYDSSGVLPIIYSNINCHGWEQSINSCTKSSYPHFTCSSNALAGVLCPDGCVNGNIRLIGGSSSSEGTVEVCVDHLWGLISEVAWDNEDARVICRQLNLPFDGAYPVYGSQYGKPDRAVHYSYVLCHGNEQSITECDKVPHPLNEGRTIYDDAKVAGVVCNHAELTVTPPPCVPLPNTSNEVCTDGNLQLEGESGLMEYCLDGQWSLICQLTHNETTVACRQLGYTTYTWGLPYSIDQSSVSSSVDATLISSIKCTSNELSLKDCSIVKQTECMKYCESVLGLQCYHPSNCSEGHVRLVDGDIEQEGRVEVCVNGVWGSICDNGWDQTDAHVICRQLGYSSLEPLSFHGDHFGPSKGPVLYSNVECGGWEEGIEECDKETHLKTLCSHDTVAGVMCSDDCSNGKVRLVGGDSPNMGTVEVCYDNLWGLINEDGWGLPDADVVCRQLSYDKASEGTTGSQFGHPNKVVHIGGVGCIGTEQSLFECPSIRYSIAIGRNLTSSHDIGIAGVICHHEPDTTSSTSYNTSIHSSPVNTRGDALGSKPSNSPMILALIVLVAIAIVIMG